MTNKKKKIRKRIIIASIAVLLTGAIAVGLVIIRHNRNKAFVQLVDEVNNTWALSGATSYGTIEESAQQKIYLDPERSVKEVFVKTGDTVKAGEKLFSYDTELLELNVQEKQLSVDIYKSHIEIEKKKLEEYKAIVPSTEPPTETVEDSTNEEITDEDIIFDEDGDETGDGEEPEEPEITYTADEKAQLVADQTLAVKKLENSLAIAENDLKQAKKELSDTTVKAAVSGTVTEIKDKSDASSDGSPFCTILGDSGVTLKGTISEYDLPDTHVGDTLSVTSWMSGNTTSAEITAINDYPVENGSFYYDSSSEISYYEFTAHMENADGFEIGEEVEITRDLNLENDIIVLEKVYVRTDDEGSYVMVDDGGVLERRAVKTAKCEDNEYIIITDGLSSADYIAFPYGESGKAGTKTTTQYQFSLF